MIIQVPFKWTLAAIAAALVLCTGYMAYGQNAASGSLAASQSQAAAGSISGVTINNSPVPTDKNGVLLGSSGNPNVSEIRNVPNVSAPAVFGGGHPCLAGRSGGFSLVGGGLSYGQGEAEPVCMLWNMGQPEAALRLLARQNSAACEAMANVGYVRVGNQVLPFGGCGKVVKGGVETPGVASRPAKVKATRSVAKPLAKCELRADGAVVVKAKGWGNKPTAQQIAGCKARLGVR